MGYGVDCDRGYSGRGSQGVGVVDAFAVDAVGSGAAGADRAAGRRRGRGEGHRGAGRGVQADGDRVEEALYGRGAGWADDRPKPGRPATVDEVAVVLATL